MSEVRGHREQQPTTRSELTARRDFLNLGTAILAGSSLGWGACTDGETPDAESHRGALPTSDAVADWANIRDQFLIEPGSIYLNNGSIGVSPQPVLDAIAENYRQISSNPTRAKGDLYRYIKDRVLPSLGGLSGAGPDEITFMSNATEGLGLITNGIALQPGDEVLTTTHEHPAGITPWRARAQREDIILREIPIPSPLISKEQAIEPLRKAMNDRTKVLFFCQVTRGGLLYPVKELCALARERGIISAVDGAQAIGMLQIDLHDLGCDLYACSLHKWLLSPMGTGMLYVRRGFQDRFFPSNKEGQPAGATRYQSKGTQSVPIRAAIGDALEFCNTIGMPRIEERSRMLSDYLKAELVKIPRVRLVSSTSPEVSSPGMTMFEVEGQGGLKMRARFEKRNISVDEHVRDGHDSVRVSTHYYNTKAEIDRTMEILRELA